MPKESFFKTIAKAFVEEVQEEQEEPVVDKVQPTATTVQIKPTVYPASDGTIQGHLDNVLFEQLCSIIEESNIPGPDYVELKNASENEMMKNAISDENARIMAAYISIKATAPNINKGIILGSIDEYVKILENEQNNGLAELEEKWNENVVIPEKKVLEAQEDIAKLQKELQDKIKYVSEKKAEIANTKNEYNIKKANFNYTFEAFIKNLKDDKAKFDAILQD